MRLTLHQNPPARALAGVLALLFTASCSSADPGSDADADFSDAGFALDSRAGGRDASGSPDGSTTEVDSGQAGLDGGGGRQDAANLDAGVPPDLVCPPGSDALVLDVRGVTLEPVGDLPPDDGFASGFEILEGPVWFGGSLYLSQLAGGSSGGRILRWVPGRPAAVWRSNAGTNGLAVSGDSLFAGRHGNGSVSRLDPNDASAPAEVVVGRYLGSRFNSPNDLVIAQNGDIYFTDPNWQAPDPDPQAAERVYHVRDGEVIDVVAGAVQKPNGIMLSPSERYLFVGGTNGLFRYPVDASGAVGSGSAVAGVSTAVDGLGRDCAGNLYVTTNDQVVILDSALAMVGSLPVSGPTNAAFGGDARRTLFVTTLSPTGDARLYQARLNVPGYPY